MFKLFLSHVVNAMGETVPCIKNKMYRNRKLAFVLFFINKEFVDKGMTNS